jgi:hypothetical protein
MSIKILIMRLNANELGYRNGIPNKAGPFCIIKKDALEINGFDPGQDLIPLYYDSQFIDRVTYKRPDTKTERRLSLSSIKSSIGALNPGHVFCFNSFDDGGNGAGINISPVEDKSLYVSLLEKYGNQYKDKKTGKYVKNLLVTETIFQSKTDSINPLALSKPFLLLAGISGTGKTRFIREQAKASNPDGNLDDTYSLVPVRPDWHEPSDLLGYNSRLTSSGDPEYVCGEALLFIVKAWKELSKAGIQFIENTYKGDLTQLDNIRPFWLCLDEMNLAPVEQYFADYLSIMETREWDWESDNFCYTSDSLLKSNFINELSDISQKKLKKELGLEESEFNDLWQHFAIHGVGIPLNLIVAGTVNMDETTHGFSRKVIDRALSFDFGEFFPNDFDAYFDPTHMPITFSYPRLSNAKSSKDKLPNIDNDGSKSINFLSEINQILSNTPFKLAYRALNELLLSVICHSPENEKDLLAVWDDFLMCKVLPRIEGDVDKLASNINDNSILDDLNILLQKEFEHICGNNNRLDLYRTGLSEDIDNTIPCRSVVKINWMIKKLELGFTTFWP